jgi:hypothetical protein
MPPIEYPECPKCKQPMALIARPQKGAFLGWPGDAKTEDESFLFSCAKCGTGAECNPPEKK